jgi:activating signal cointegrator complex subunit 3
MVFVHARNDTVRTAMVLRDLAKNKNDVGFFLPEQSRQYGEAEKNVNLDFFLISEQRSTILGLILC